MKLNTIFVDLGKAIKGDRFEIDPGISNAALLEFFFGRLSNALRGSIALRRIPLRPSDVLFCGRHVRLLAKRQIRFGRGVSLGDYVTINGLSKSGVVIGNGVTIGMYSIIECTGVLSKLGEGVVFGDGSSIGPFSYIGAAGGVTIGSNVIMGQKVNFHAENHNFSDINVPIVRQGVSRKGIVIEDDCWVGANTTFLDGAHVSHGCVIAAGSVVTGTHQPHSVIGGIPARLLKTR
ncbi:MAG: hypothetical protein AMXMBFR6_02030 [Betaproteobacteria bacterium]